MSIDQKLKVLDALSGRSYLAIQAALAGLQSRHLDPEPYTIEVVDEEAYPAVVFTNLDAPPGHPKRFGVRPQNGFDLTQRELLALTTGLDRVRQDTVQGSSLPFIQMALTVFPRAGELADYRIKLVGEGEFITVIFTDKDKPRGSFGSGGPRPGYEVVMRAADHRIVRSYFLR